MTTRVPVLATDESFDLAEGPFWDPIRQQLLWVDIRAGAVLVGTLKADGTITTRDRVVFGETVGAVAVSPSGEWILAGADRVMVRTAQGEVLGGARVLSSANGRRLNDGKPDPAGRFVVGSLLIDGDSVDECLVRIRDDGEVDVIDSDLSLSNGLAWSADGSTLFSVDTMNRIIYARSYTAETGVTGKRSVFVRLADGYPDGICVDVEGHIWVAVWGLGEVRRYSPAGALTLVVEVPAPHTSSVAFGGANLATLIITTATQDLTEGQLSEFPLSGRLFTYEPGVCGVPQTLWKSSAS